MKKLKVLGLAAIAAGMVTLTSCLDGGGNSHTLQVYGVIDYSSTFKPLLYTGGDILYMSNVASDPNFSAGDCVAAYATVDLDSPENANVSTNGYYVATGPVASIGKGNFSFATLDSTALSDELLVSNVGMWPLIKSVNYRKILAIPQFETALTEQKNSYRLTFDYDQEPVTVNSTERVYTLCLRCQKLEDGKAPTVNGAADIKAFDAEQFYSTVKSRESAAGKKIASFQIKYAKGFNSDSTKVTTWGTSDIVQFSIVDSAE